MASCARHNCSAAGAGALLLHHEERRVELVPLGDPVGERYGTSLCAEHLGRVKAPRGWDIVDNRDRAAFAAPIARPRRHGAPGSSTNPGPAPWSPRRESEIIPESVASVQSPLLRRAFLGLSEPPQVPAAEISPDPDGEQLRLAV